MGKPKLAIGTEFFEQIRKEECFYADKTEMIYRLVSGAPTGVTLFTRPRRFGKTLTMTMLRSFFDINRDSRELFDGLDVSRHEEFCREWMNQYPVLFVTLKDVESLGFEMSFDKLRMLIADLCKDHSYLEKSKKVDARDLKLFDKLISAEATPGQIDNSLAILSRMMHAHFGKPVILLIDEYDVPLAKAHAEDKNGVDYYPKMLSTIKGFMSSSLKTNEHLRFAVITGCLRIANESIFTGLNNLTTRGLLDTEFADSFGFTAGEVEGLLEEAGCGDKMELVRKWYDGYVIGAEEMFCPWDVVNYVHDVMNCPKLSPDNYWKDTSSNEIIDEFVGSEEFDVTDKFEELMNGGSIRQTITERLTYGTLTSEEDNFWSVLFMTGYLTKANKEEVGSTVSLRIPNAEVASIFKDAIVSHFRRVVGPTLRDELMRALWSKDEEKVTKILTDALFDTISFFDYHEDYYHAFITGLIAGGRGVEVSSNQENGLGRSDIVVKERRSRRAIIIETKKSSSEEAMETDALAGMRQIMDRKYSKGLKGFTTIVCYGIAFFEKMALARLVG